MPFAVAGHPDARRTLRILSAYRAVGADLVELGVPWRDPFADGPVIAAASRAAAARGVGVHETLALAADAVAAGSDVVVMAYAAAVADHGAFFAGCGRAGVTGAVIPDLPRHQVPRTAAVAASYGVALAGFLTPAATREQMAEVVASASGFVYCALTGGPTGGRGRLPSSLPEFLARVRGVTPLPLAVGFGIRTTAQARRVAAVADCVIVGSALVEMVGAPGAGVTERSGNEAYLVALAERTRSFSDAVHGVRRRPDPGGAALTTR